jgi:hypothetical protein
MPADVFGAAWDRIDSRLTIVNWPVEPPDALVAAITNLVRFEPANSAPSVLPGAGDADVLVWRGYLTGGIAALYEQLIGFVDEHGLVALMGDARLEVHVAGGSRRVAVLGALRHTVVADRDEFVAKLVGAASANDLATGFLQDALNRGAEDVLVRALERDRAQEGQLGSPPPKVLPQTPPGELDVDLLDEATVEVIETYDPERDLVDALIRCEAFGGWRTDFLAPGLGHLDAEPWEDTFCWRAVQWRSVSDHAERPNDVGDADDADGLWRLHARAELAVDAIARWMPADVVPWPDRMTRRCLDELDKLAEVELPDRAGIRGRLEADLTRLRRGSS